MLLTWARAVEVLETPKVMSLGTAYVASLGLWEIARPHLEALVARTGESSSMAQLDGSDIRWAVQTATAQLAGLTPFVAHRTRFADLVVLACPVPAILDWVQRLPDYIQHPCIVIDIGSTKRAIVTARGEVFTVPVEDGSTRNISNSASVREYTAIWSPAGDRLLTEHHAGHFGLWTAQGEPIRPIKAQPAKAQIRPESM